MFTPVRSLCRRPCSTYSITSQARTSSGIPPTGVLYQRKPIPKNARSPIYGFTAPSTSGISPVDVEYSRFLNRHAPLEIANRLLRMAERRPKSQSLQESVIWQSATASEYEMAQVPREALEAIKSSAAPPMQEDESKVVVVPFQADPSGKDFYEHLMSAVQDGLEKIEGYEMTSTKRKRRLKMNKHKFKKRRKEQKK